MHSAWVRALTQEVPLQLVPYANPGLLADAAVKDEWDVGLIGAEPKRAETITFTASYAEILATYMVRPGRGLHSIADVDRPGVRVCVSECGRACVSACGRAGRRQGAACVRVVARRRSALASHGRSSRHE